MNFVSDIGAIYKSNYEYNLQVQYKILLDKYNED